MEELIRFFDEKAANGCVSAAGFQAMEIYEKEPTGENWYKVALHIYVDGIYVSTIHKGKYVTLVDIPDFIPVYESCVYALRAFAKSYRVTNGPNEHGLQPGMYEVATMVSQMSIEYFVNDAVYEQVTYKGRTYNATHTPDSFVPKQIKPIYGMTTAAQLSAWTRVVNAYNAMRKVYCAMRISPVFLFTLEGSSWYTEEYCTEEYSDVREVPTMVVTPGFSVNSRVIVPSDVL